MNIYERAIEKFGEEAQILMLLEEMSELSTLLFHKLRNNRKPDNWQIAEEVADVEIMLEQLKYMIPSIREEIDDFKIKKLYRLGVRVRDE